MAQKSDIQRSFLLMRAIHSREVIEGLRHFAQIKHLFDLGELNSQNHLFEPLVRLINFKYLFQKNHFSKQETKDFLHFISDTLLGEEEAAQEIKHKFASVLFIVFGAISSDWSLLEEGIGKLHKGFVIMLNIFRLFSKIRSFQKIKIKQLLQYKIPLAERVRDAIRALMGIMVRAAEFAKNGADAGQEDIRSSYLHSDAGIDVFKKKEGHIKDWMDSIVKVIDADFENIADVINVSEKEILGMLVVENKRQPDEEGEERDRYELIMEAIVTGNIHLLLNVLQEWKGGDSRLKGVCRLVLAGYEIIGMNRYSFEKVAEEALRTNQETQIDIFTEEIGKLLKVLVDERLNSKKQGLPPREIKALEQCSRVIGNKVILSRVIFTIQALRFNKLNKSFALTFIIQLIKAVLESVDHKIPDQLIIALFGCLPQEMIDIKAKRRSTAERIELLLDFLITFYLPDFKQFKPLFQRLVSLIFELFTLNSYHDIGSVLHSNVENLGHLYGVNPELLEGLVGILSGDYYALARMAAPIADINPDVITRLISFIEDVRNLVNDFTRRRAMLTERRERRGAGDFKEDQWRDLRQKILDGKAANRELFHVADQEGDANGRISKEEFRTMIWRLQIKLSDHRIDEIFSASQHKVHGSDDKNDEELDEREFDEAMKYIGLKTSKSALEILGISTTQLVLMFVVLLVVLLLTFVFLFLGIHAFSIGGTFGSIINSILPITAGIIVGRKKDVNEKTEQKKADKAYEKVETILQIEE